jgi:hypothetical protein
MKNVQLLQKTLSATILVHQQYLDCPYWCGYDADKEAFDNLYREVYAIVHEELPDDADLEQIVNLFNLYQLEITDGERDVCWFL